ncbi:MAG: HAD family hydrolase [Spirochaetales bacterium]|nr:HAD family hydrolase [Spirochaetales bacterium]
MAKPNLVIFDFDGTLYPFRPYDSEQTLVLSHAKTKGPLFRLRARLFVRADRKGAFNNPQFYKRYERMIRDVDPALVEKTAKDLAGLLGKEDVEAIRDLATIADLAILSLGTENLAEFFLRELGLREEFFLIKGKRIRRKKGKAYLKVNIGEAEDKRTHLESLRKSYGKIVAIGDGPTDIPMLEAADLGLLLIWGARSSPLPFELHSSLPSACDRAKGFLIS